MSTHYSCSVVISSSCLLYLYLVSITPLLYFESNLNYYTISKYFRIYSIQNRLFQWSCAAVSFLDKHEVREPMWVKRVMGGTELWHSSIPAGLT